jgi:predicted GNAT family N-acyltransferase
MIRIREASSNEELETVFGFRYRIYVDEMGRPQKDADHERRRIRDKLDDTAINLAAWNDGEIVGVARVNFARNGHLGMYDEFYEMGSVATDHPNRTSIVTRLMLAPEFRHSGLAVQMFCACFGIGFAAGFAGTSSTATARWCRCSYASATRSTCRRRFIPSTDACIACDSTCSTSRTCSG